MEFHPVALLLVLLVAWLAGLLSRRVGLLPVLGELAAGVIIGPALLGSAHWPAWVPLLGGRTLGFASTPKGLSVLAEVGVFLLMLYIGMEVDFRDLFKAKWAGFWASVGGFTIPFALGYGLGVYQQMPREGALFLGLAMGVTAMAANSRILVDLDLFGTRIASVLLAGALISDTVVLVAFAAILGLTGADGHGLAQILLVIVKAVTFFCLAVVLGLKGLPPLGSWASRMGLTHRTGNFTLVLVIALLYGALAAVLGLHPILGAFLAGMFLREGVLHKKLSHEITHLVHDLSLGFLTPVFFILAGFHMNLQVVTTHTEFLVLVIVAATVGKMVGTAALYPLSGYSFREGLVIGAGMNGRGVVEIVVAEIGLRMGLIDRNAFSVLVIMAFLTTLTVPALLKAGTAWLRRRGDLARTDEARRATVIVGASPLARLLAAELASTGDPVSLIDSNPNRCAAARRQGLQAIQGNALTTETLALAGAREAGTLLAMTGNSEVNSVTAQLATELFAVPHVLTLTPARARATHRAAHKTPPHASLPVFGGPVDIPAWDQRILRNEIGQTAESITTHTPIREFFEKTSGDGGSLPLAVRRGEHRLLPAVAAELQPGDEVLVLRHVKREDPLAERFHKLLRGCPLLDLNGPMELEAFFDKVAEAIAPRLAMPPTEARTRLLDRELESSTVIVPGLAIPHATLEGQGRFDLLVARCREGIVFPDGSSDTRTVFVLFSSRDERNMHLRALSEIARIARHPKFDRRWLEAEDSLAMRHVLLATEYAEPE